MTSQALAGILGGTQSLHTNSFDEALALPGEVETEALAYIEEIREMGDGSMVDGVLSGIAEGYFDREIQAAAYEYQTPASTTARRWWSVSTPTRPTRNPTPTSSQSTSESRSDSAPGWRRSG